MKAQAPQSHFLKCFDLSDQSARVISSLLLPASPRFLIKARLLAGCPWSARNSPSNPSKESNIQRLNSLTSFPMFRWSYRWNTTWTQRSPLAFINAAEAFHCANNCVIMGCCLWHLERKADGPGMKWTWNYVRFSILFVEITVLCLRSPRSVPLTAEHELLVSELPSGTFQHSRFIPWTGKWREAQQLEK